MARLKSPATITRKKNLYEFSETEVVNKKPNDILLIFNSFSLQFVDSLKNELTGTAECIPNMKDPTENCFGIFTVELIRYDKKK